MNILIGLLKYPPDFTGAGQRLHRIYRRLRTKGVKDVYVIATSLGPFFSKHQVVDGVQVEFIGNNRYIESSKSFGEKFGKLFYIIWASGKAILAYRRIVHKIDLVHTVDSSWLSTVIAWCAFFTRKPLVKEIVLLDCDDPGTLKRTKSFLSRYFFLFPFQYAQLIIVISAALQRACCDYGISAKKIWCRFNPVDFGSTNGHKIENEKVLDALIWDGAKILYVGTISRRKNIKFLLESVPYLQGKLSLLFIGPCKEESYCREVKDLASRLMDRYQPRIKISFLENIEDRRLLQEIYKKSDLFWFASLKEGMGNVVAEALVCGTPVVALPVQGIMYELLQSPEEGEIVETDDPKIFAQAVNRSLYEKVYDRNAIASNAKERFDPEKIENGYLEKFQAILK